MVAFAEQDIPLPFSFLLFRPHITHNMSTGILCKAGSNTGETLVGHADFQLADDVVRKMHYGNFTIYSKSIVYKSDAVTLAENIYATGYVRGNDVSFNTLDSLNKSIFVCMIPAPDFSGEEMVSSAPEMMNPIDITGSFASQVPHLAMLESELGNTSNHRHYASSSLAATRAPPCRRKRAWKRRALARWNPSTSSGTTCSPPRRYESIALYQACPTQRPLRCSC